MKLATILFSSLVLISHVLCNQKVASYTINFTDNGNYDQYAIMSIGSVSWNDDSFFSTKGFGEKSSTSDADWYIINGIENTDGIINTYRPKSDEIVSGNGKAGTFTMKWKNLDYGIPGTDKLSGVTDEYPDLAYQQVITYINPVLPGDHPDPTLLKADDDFYHCVSSFHFTPYLPVLHSTDLVHWKEISRVVPPDWPGLLNDNPSYGIWQGAITCFYDSYWIYFSNTAGGGQYFCKADKPEGPWSAPVKLKTTATTGASGYDNSVFVDDDGTPYMLIKPGQYFNRIQEIGTDGHLTGTVINMDWINANEQYSWAEGPVMCKRNGWYYYFIAENVWGGQYVLRSQSLTGDSTQWETMGSVFAPTTDPLATLRTPNHMTQPFQLKDGTWWTIAHSYEKVSGNNWAGLGRQGILHQINWDTGGKPTATAPTSLPMLKPELPQSGISWKLSRSDYFDGETIDLSWHFLNKTAAAQYSLTDRPGWLRISPGSGRSHILHKDCGHYYTLVTRVHVDANEANQAAGIYLTNGNESVNIRLFSGYSEGKKIIFTFNDITYESDNELGNTIWLKLDRKGHDLYGYYSINGLVWIQVGESISAIELDKEQPNFNSWVGNSHGLFAEGIQADFDLFFYKDGFSELPVAGYNNYFGIETSTKSVGNVVTNTTGKGGWLMLGGVELGKGEKIPVEVEVSASSISGGNLEIWLDNLGEGGTKVATIPISATGSEDSFQTFSTYISGVSGQHDVYLLFHGVENAFYLYTIRFIPDEKYFSGVNNEIVSNDCLNIFPNPFNDALTIDIKHGKGMYSIYDLSGKKVEGEIIISRSYNVGRDLPPMIYILKIKAKDKNNSVKIVKFNNER
jgi:xylan 1,4-beta-xylosidase